MHRRNRNHYIAKGMPVIGSIEVQRPKRGLIVAKGDRRISAFNSQIVGTDHLRHVGADLIDIVATQLAAVRQRKVADLLPGAVLQIGRASGRDRVCQYVSNSVVAVYLKNKKINRS